jgi:hypothetical protein
MGGNGGFCERFARRGGHATQALKQTLATDEIAGLRIFEQDPDMIEGREGQIDEIGRHRKPAAAHLVKRIFEVVREAGERVEAEHGTRSLDGVQRTKGATHKFHVVAALVELEQGGLEIEQNLARLFAEGLAKLISSGC